MRTLPDSLQAWPATAADFAIYSLRQILTEGRTAGNEAALMAIRRTRSWWAVSTLSEGLAGPRKRRAKAFDTEGALEVLHRHRASLQRTREGQRVTVGTGLEGPDFHAALRTLGLEHLPLVNSIERAKTDPCGESYEN